MTARAEGGRSAERGSRTSACFVVLACAIASLATAPASAQVGLSASIFSDARFRGYSLSGEHPVASFDFAYDDRSGAYAGGAATVLLKGEYPEPLSLQVDAGYARRLGSGTTFDVGIAHANYGSYSRGRHGSSYTELYGGIARGRLSSRLSISPHYFATGQWTAYGEVNGNVSPASEWTLDGHVGMLVPLRTPAGLSARSGLDWSVGATRSIGRLSLHATWTDRTPGHDFYARRPGGRNALVLGASVAL